VSRVDGGVSLDKVVVGASPDDPPLGTGNAGSYGVAEAEGVPDGDDPLAHPQLVGVAQGGDGQVPVGGDFDQSQVRLGVTADDLRIELSLICE
jgi:hypothetical protein